MSSAFDDDAEGDVHEEEQQENEEQPAAEEQEGGGGEEAPSTATTGASINKKDKGIPSGDLQVYMAESKDAAVPNACSDGRTIYTEAMSDCCAIATYNPQNGERTLVHLKGGQAGNDYYEKLADMISEDTDVIIAVGTNSGSEEGFRVTVVKEIQDQLNNAMAEKGKALDQAKYQIFWTDEGEDKKNGLRLGSFGINASAEYGRIVN